MFELAILVALSMWDRGPKVFFFATNVLKKFAQGGSTHRKSELLKINILFVYEMLRNLHQKRKNLTINFDHIVNHLINEYG